MVGNPPTGETTTMQETEAMDFYQRIVEGKKSGTEISLQIESGHTLTDVVMSPIDKKTLAGVIERLPEEMFEAVDEAEGDAEEAQESMEGDLSAVTEDTVEAFEDLLKKSLSHPKLTNSQMADIINALNFEMLFELGTKVIDMSVEQTGEIQDFHEQE